MSAGLLAAFAAGLLVGVSGTLGAVVAVALLVHLRKPGLAAEQDQALRLTTADDAQVADTVAEMERRWDT